MKLTESYYEQQIRKLLIKHKIDFKAEYSFSDLRGLGGGLLRFDFAVFKKNKLLFLIEYDGEYHYLPIESEEQLKYLQSHDRIKDNYAKIKNIPLLRIPYWWKDEIEYVVKQELKKYNLIK